MIKFLLLSLFFLLIGRSAISQVIVSPYAAIADDTGKKTLLKVSNKTHEPQEISIMFKFAYDVSDENGFRDIRYLKGNERSSYDLSPMLSVEEDNFTLKPGEERGVEVVISPLPELPEGTYWTKALISYKSAASLKEGAGTGKVNLNPEFSQVTTIIYKNKRYNAAVDITDLKLSLDNSVLKVRTSYALTGNPPFFAEADIKIKDSNNRIVKERIDYFTLYFEMTRSLIINAGELKAGEYTVELILNRNKTEVPSPDNIMQPIVKQAVFTIP